MTESAPQPYVLFYSRDIFFAGSVKAAAAAAGCQLKIVGSIDAELPADINENTQACVVDLTTLGLEDIATWGEKLADRYPEARRIAFGPHVQTEHFAAANAAGFHAAIAKGQVGNLLAKLIAQ
jgi:hypothetical protein